MFFTKREMFKFKMKKFCELILAGIGIFVIANMMMAMLLFI